jgi:plastocyanin
MRRQRLRGLALAALLLLPGGRAQAAEQLPVHGGSVSGSVVTVDKKGRHGRAGVVVSVACEGGDGAGAGGAATPRIRQRDTAFDPALTVITVGTTVEFPNDDKIFHNVFSLSEPAKFDLGLYKSGTTRSVTFRRPGVVDVYCNIHPQMVAKIKVMENEHWAITRSDGSFKIDHLPPGRHAITAWQPSGESRSSEIVIAAGETTRAELELPEATPGHGHLRKDGTPYGRYK